MSQTFAQREEQAPPPTDQVNFSDGNRALHLQTFFKWLPEPLHDAPRIDWSQLPSKVMAYLVNTVGENPFAAPLALVAATGVGAVKGYTLAQHVARVNLLLRSVQALCGATLIADLTKSTWEAYVSQKELTPGDFAYFRSYATATERHLLDYLEQLDLHERIKVEPYVLPHLPRGFRHRYLPSAAFTEAAKQRRKSKSDILAPLHTLLVAMVQFRKQEVDRLVSASREALTRAKMGNGTIPISFSYQEELVTINRDARTVADIRLEKRLVTLRFLLWDRRSWVLEHKDHYSDTTRRIAELGIEDFAEPQFFVQCLNPADELLWFGDLIKYRLLQHKFPQNIAPEDHQRRRELLSQIAVTLGLTCGRDGVLTPAHEFTNTLSHAIARTGALVFDPEALWRGTLFGAALATIALTNGSRMCELLQVSADRFKMRPYVTQEREGLGGEERVMHLQVLLPKGKRTEAERKLFLISDGAYKLLGEIAQELRRAHQGHIPVVRPHPQNVKAEDLTPERYLFQWAATSDGKSGAFGPEDVLNLLRFILYGLDFRTKEGDPFSVTIHLLRHVMATSSRHEYEVPASVVARALHHEHHLPVVPASTEYYSQETEEHSLAVFARFQVRLEDWAESLVVEFPDEQELANMDEDLRASFERWHTLLETTLGFCGNIDLCPRGYNRTLCIGCPHLVPDPRKKNIALHWRRVYAQLAEELEAQGSTIDARQYRLLVQDLDDHIASMAILQAAIEDGSRKPFFLQLPSTAYEEVIIDAQAETLSSTT